MLRTAGLAGAKSRRVRIIRTKLIGTLRTRRERAALMTMEATTRHSGRSVCGIAISHCCVDTGG